jgi:hypothetical protein
VESDRYEPAHDSHRSGWKPEHTAAKDGRRYGAVLPIAPRAAQFFNASIDQNRARWHHSRPT